MWHTVTMRYTRYLMVSFCIGALAPALAADPPIPPSVTSAPVQSVQPAADSAPSPAAETQAEAKAKAVAQAKTDADAKATADADAKAKAVDKRLRAMGYKPINNNGTLRYCKNEQVLGSRFERAVCGTPEELDFAAQNGQETVQRIQQNNSSLPAGK